MSTKNFVKMAPPVLMWEASAQNIWDALCKMSELIVLKLGT